MENKIILAVNFTSEGPHIYNIPNVLEPYQNPLQTLLLCYQGKQFYQTSINDYSFYVLSEEVKNSKNISKLSITYIDDQSKLNATAIKQALEYKMQDIKSDIERLKNSQQQPQSILSLPKIAQQQDVSIQDISNIQYLQKYLSQLYFALLNGYKIGIFTLPSINLQNDFLIMQNYTKYILNGRTTILPKIAGIVNSSNLAMVDNYNYSSIKSQILGKHSGTLFCGQLCQFFDHNLAENFDMVISLASGIQIKDKVQKLKKINSHTYSHIANASAVMELTKVGQLRDWPNGQELYVNLQNADMNIITNEILKLTYKTWFEDIKNSGELSDRTNSNSIASSTPQRNRNPHSSRPSSVDRQSQIESCEYSEPSKKQNSSLARRVLSIDELDD